MPQPPDLVEYNGKWEPYRDQLYGIFHADFVASCPHFRGSKVVLGHQRVIDGKEWVFWHIIQEGEDEQNRLPNFRRCERIRWVRFVIENADGGHVKVWENRRGRDTRICLCYGDWEYLVILTKRQTHLILVTAYPVEYGWTKKKLQKEYNDYIAKSAR
ncbi:MAG: hypothetical protein Greene041619_998 [Candidatus Peregrinibacteria bacterium Greene0416_19]|nr:MAG: hypothetical protein Greene041619_998 [Candidatus Peregrinibacteria bacterium Greene0416_19]